MKENPTGGFRTRPNRRSIRLKGYDYSQPGAYFVTIVTQDRGCLFGQVVDGEMRVNDAGRMIQSVWDEMPAFYSGIDTDEFVVMPNHIHGIVVLVGATPCGRPGAGQGQAQGPAPTLSLADVVHRFKTMTTTRYIRWCETSRLAALSRPVVATQLLRTHHPQRRILESYPPVHRRKPVTLVS